MWPSGL